MLWPATVTQTCSEKRRPPVGRVRLGPSQADWSLPSCAPTQLRPSSACPRLCEARRAWRDHLPTHDGRLCVRRRATPAAAALFVAVLYIHQKPAPWDGDVCETVRSAPSDSAQWPVRSCPACNFS